MSSFYDLASLVMIPSGKKAGKVYSQKPLTTDGQLDFTRASTATRIGPDGKIEKTRTNLYTQSNNFSHSDWSPKAGTFTSGVADPNGGTNAWSWTATNTDPFLYQAKTLSGLHCLSIYIKGVGSSIGKDFQVRTGAALKDFTLTANWQRVEHFGNLTSSTNIGFEYGNPAATNDVVHIYAAQLEPGLVATDYIDTTTAAVSVGSVDNMPRLNYTPGSATSCPSLLLEPQRTNVITYSEDFSQSYWTKSNTSIVINNAISPDGSMNASKLIENSNNSEHICFNAQSGSSKTFSFFAKSAGNQYVAISYDGGGNFNFFDIKNGILGNLADANRTSKIEHYGNGWYRCSMYNGHSTFGATIWMSKDGTNTTYQGDGTSGIYIYGAQMEAASYPSSYIPTFGATVTRVADACSKASVSSLIGQTEGTLFVEIEEITKESGGYFLEISDNSNTNRILVQNGSGANTINLYAQSSAGTQVNTNPTDTFIGRVKIAIAYANNDFKVYANGLEVFSQASFDVPTCSKVSVGIRYNNTQHMGGEVNKTILFKTRLTNDQLAELTSIDS